MKKLSLILTIIIYSVISFPPYGGTEGYCQTASTWNASGVILSSAGYVATVNHVLEPGYHFEVDVFNNGIKKTYQGNVVKADPVNNLAIIKIDDPLFITVGAMPYSFKIGGVKNNEKIFVMGYPQIEPAAGGMKLVEGTINSKSGYPNDINLYQLSCTMNPGEAGAPMFDNSGNLVGIINSGTASGQNAGYAIKISCLHNLLETLPSVPLSLKTVISALSFTDKVEALTKCIVSVRVSNQVVSDTSTGSKKMLVGQTYGGGIIFYVDDTGEHGLIASIDYGDNKRAPWGCDNLLINDTETGVGTGKENTKVIVTGCRSAGSQNIAARLCDQLILDGYSDWFLPSKEELNILFEQKDIIGGYEHGYYWSSSEFTTLFAWYQHFDFGFQDYLNKELLYYYRPIRSF